MADDPHDLERFVAAQDGVLDAAIAELRAGRKRSHWMWFIFPQLRGLGRSATAQAFGVASLAEARAYLEHPELGPRLAACVAAALSVRGRTLHDIFGSPDDLKFRSSMTLFERAAPGEPIFAQALDRLCDGMRDEKTIDLLERDQS
jgi:uncharacterized protein (DUF1810 family)